MIESLNRAFLYGESVFTTLRMVDGRLQDWDLHFERLKKGVDFVYGPFLDGDAWPGMLKDRLVACVQNETGDKVIRFTVYRHQARGLRRTRLLSVSDLKINLIASPYEPQRSENRSARLRSASASQRPHWWPDYLKAGSYLDVILAQKVFLKERDDDLLFLSSGDTVLESSVANIFVVRHNKLFTAPTGPNVLDGVMRRRIIDVAHDYFDDVQTEETTMEQLLKADAVFGSNSVRGPFLVTAVDDHEFAPSREFLEKFNALRERLLQ